MKPDVPPTLSRRAGRLAAGVILLMAASSAAAATLHFPLEDAARLRPHNVTVGPATHQGRKAVRVVESENVDGPALVILEGSSLTNGVIEVELASQPATDAPEGSRGFAGIAFRVAENVSGFDCFYLRPTNGRADDQVRRNHSTQYISHPDYPWHRLRKEEPGKYESYVDLVPGRWTRMRIEITGETARLYIDEAEQPVLIVNDLKRGTSTGGVALWIGQGTEAWFRNLRITSAD